MVRPRVSAAVSLACEPVGCGRQACLMLICARARAANWPRPDVYKLTFGIEPPQIRVSFVVSLANSAGKSLFL